MTPAVESRIGADPCAILPSVVLSLGGFDVQLVHFRHALALRHYFYLLSGGIGSRHLLLWVWISTWMLFKSLKIQNGNFNRKLIFLLNQTCVTSYFLWKIHLPYYRSQWGSAFLKIHSFVFVFRRRKKLQV